MSELVKLPIDTNEIIKLLSSAHDMKMAILQQIYDKCDPDTVQGQTLMAQVDNIGVIERDSHEREIELIKQNQDLQTKNDILVRTLEIVRENKEEVLHRMETYRVRAERMKNSQQAAQKNSHTTAAYERISQSNGRR